MFIDGDEPPPRYIVRENAFGPLDSSAPLTAIPVIDIGLLSGSSPAATDGKLGRLRSALSSWGCFQAIGHGIPESYLDKVRDAARRFFALPVEEKRKYARAPKEGEGYGGDLIVSDKQVLDWSDRLALKVLPEDGRRLNLWPENPTDFREIIEEYPMKIKPILDLLFRAAAKCLNLEEDCFLKQFGERAELIARFNFYPP